MPKGHFIRGLYPKGEAHGNWKGIWGNCLDCSKPLGVHKHKAKSNLCRQCFNTKYLKGENHPSWRGGITVINHGLRKTLEYKEWRKAVLKKDGYRCFDCGVLGGRLQADHIYRFSDYPRLRLDLNNGRALCADCHRKTLNYGKSGYKKQLKPEVISLINH